MIILIQALLSLNGSKCCRFVRKIKQQDAFHRAEQLHQSAGAGTRGFAGGAMPKKANINSSLLYDLISNPDRFEEPKKLWIFPGKKYYPVSSKVTNVKIYPLMNVCFTIWTSQNTLYQ